ncbi:ABC transporter ATP-binding protein [Actinoplanes sp. NPDC049668]|uniref:ABC transporter ATP-binding protein n=1 Tax=unclassified Actinoplanes TaxID=2626549 RepID=UPI0033B1D686
MVAEESEQEADVVLLLRGVNKSFVSEVETVRAVRDVSLAARPGQFLCIHGASGSGKSTLVSVLAGLDVPDSGEVVIDGVDVANLGESERSRLRLERVGVIFQGDELIDEFTAVENVALPLEMRGTPSSEAFAQAKDQLTRVGIGDLSDRLPHQMSGGQRQRVGVARALTGNRRVLLADEPTGALDSKTSRGMFELFRHLCDEGALAIVCSHDPACGEYADRVYEMSDGELLIRGESPTRGPRAESH